MLKLPIVPDYAVPAWHLFVVRTQHRDRLQEYLNNAGIGTLIHYPIPPFLQDAYKDMGLARGTFPLTEKISDEIISLPIYVGLSEGDLGNIIDTIKAFPSE